MKFNTPEEAVAYAMSIKPKPKYFRLNNWSKKVARIGRYDWLVKSPDFGKYYVDIHSPFGSANKGVPENFPTYEAAREYLESIGFEAVEVE
ncbi:MAG: hypothetical protein ACI4P4_03785 [Faecousia sp.]